MSRVYLPQFDPTASTASYALGDKAILAEEIDAAVDALLRVLNGGLDEGNLAPGTSFSIANGAWKEKYTTVVLSARPETGNAATGNGVNLGVLPSSTIYASNWEPISASVVTPGLVTAPETVSLGWSSGAGAGTTSFGTVTVLSPLDPNNTAISGPMAGSGFNDIPGLYSCGVTASFTGTVPAGKVVLATLNATGSAGAAISHISVAFRVKHVS